MNTRSIALVAIFAAVSTALGVVRIPTFYWPGLWYTLAEIPIVVAFLLFGFKIGILAEVLHVAGQEIFFPAGLSGAFTYPMGAISITLMITGIYLANRLITHKIASGNHINEKKSAIYLTAFAIASRGGIMPFFDYGLMYHVLLPLALGYAIPEVYIAGLIPGFVIYNITVAFYTIPIAFVVATKVSNYLKIEPALLKQIHGNNNILYDSNTNSCSHSNIPAITNDHPNVNYSTFSNANFEHSNQHYINNDAYYNSNA